MSTSQAFWARRARRLLPALVVVIAAVVLVASVVSTPAELATLRGDSLASLFYVANWRDIVTNTSYWGMFQAPSPLRHMWSLAIEEQFYLLWPLVFAVVAARSRSAGPYLDHRHRGERAGGLGGGLRAAVRSRRSVEGVLRHRHPGRRHPPRRPGGLPGAPPVGRWSTRAAGHGGP